MSVFVDRLCCRLRVFERVVLDSRRVCEILVCAVMRYHGLSWSLSFLRKVEDLGSVCVGSTSRPASSFDQVGDQQRSVKIFVCHQLI
jgi:hypothetical protein